MTGGTRVLSDRDRRPHHRRVRADVPRQDDLARRGHVAARTPNEIALSILLASLTLVFLAAVATLAPMATYAGAPQDLVVLVALLVCLIPTTIGALLSAIGIAGMDRLVRVNVLAMSGRAVEAAGDVSTLLLDKTGTITYGNRQASRFVAAPGVGDDELRDAARLSSIADQTPEGRSVVELALTLGADDRLLPDEGSFVEFTAQTRMSGVDLPDGTQVRKGAGSAIGAWLGIEQPAEVHDVVEGISREGGTPLVIGRKDAAGTGTVLGVIHLKDVVKEGMAERFAELRSMGIRTVMITGDNALTARAIAAEAGVDDFLAEATPEDKMAYIHREQEGGRLVAMTGDGTNDAPALAAADVGVAMNSGTAAAKEAGNMVDLDSDPTKLIDIVEIGKQLLITRGALTTFSIANDVAKYFAIIPAMFVAAYPSLDRLNVMELASPQSAILSAVVFNALVIVALIPLALRGVRFRAAVGDVGPAAQHPRVRPRRHRRAVRRHQAHRPARLHHPRNRLTMFTDLYRQSLAGLRLLLVMTVLLGVGYPAAVWAAGQAFGDRADGSLVRLDGQVVGSRLIGQQLEGDQWFHSRPSANDYDTLASGPSNLGPLSTDLLTTIDERRAEVADREGVDGVRRARRRADRLGVRARPAHLPGVRRSCRPHASPRPTACPSTRSRTWSTTHTDGRGLGFLGEPGVNVLELNLAVATARSRVETEPVERGRLRVYLGAAPGSARPTPCSTRATAGPSAAPTWSSATSRRTAGRRPSTVSTASRSSPRRRSTTAAPRRRRWTSTRSSSDVPTWCWSTSSRTPTCRAAPTRSAGRTSRRCSTPASRSSPPSTSSTSSRSTT